MTNADMDIDEALAARRAQRIRGALLRPASIALVGASDDAGKTSGRPLPFLRRAGYAGRIYPVNPRKHLLVRRAVGWSFAGAFAWVFAIGLLVRP